MKKNNKTTKNKNITVKTGNKNTIKQKLLNDYGMICWNCGRELKLTDLTIHHVHQFCCTHTTTCEDSMTLCKYCHFQVVNRIRYNSKEYWRLMEEIRRKIREQDW